jgi:hypothetical protein
MNKERQAYLEALEKVLKESAFWVFLNANDVWFWACADACRIDVGEDLDKFVKVYMEFGFEGQLAFMSLIENLEPQEPMWRHSDKEKYLKAKKWLKENNLEPSEDSGWKSAACEDKDALIDLLTKENARLKKLLEQRRILLDYNAELKQLLKPLIKLGELREDDSKRVDAAVVELASKLKLSKSDRFDFLSIDYVKRRIESQEKHWEKLQNE